MADYDGSTGTWPYFSLDIPVRFAETDLMGVVHHSVYVVWFEAARVAWMDVAGMPYAEVAALGRHFAVTSIQVEYRAPARFGDRVSVAAIVTNLRSRYISFAYRITNGASGELLATGSTQHICVDLEGHTARIPDWVLARLKERMQSVPSAESLR